MAPELERVILKEFGYELAWIDATFMRDGPDHPAFKMARALYWSRREKRVAPVVHFEAPKSVLVEVPAPDEDDPSIA